MDEPFAIGAEVEGRFVIHSRLGDGGTGVVYRATDRERASSVALKVLRDNGPDGRYYFKREFRNFKNALNDARGAGHGNVIKLYEFFETAQQCFFTMEFIDGVDVLRFVRGDHSGSLDSEGMVRLSQALDDMVTGIQYIHRANLAHCDIKPSNILVTTDGVLKILDFGLSRQIVTEQHRSGSYEFHGTLIYAAPEQMLGDRQPSVDWYALGVTLYEILTGEFPFTGATYEELLERKQQGLPDDRRRALPDQYRDMVGGLLDPLPERRKFAPAPRRAPDARPSSIAVVEPATHDPFVGRQAEISRLGSIIKDIEQTGSPAVVYVHGPAGIGKTRLVNEFLADKPARHNAIVFRGQCLLQESVPYKALDPVMDDLYRYLMRLELDDRSELRRIAPRRVSALIDLFPVFKRIASFRDIRGQGQAARQPLQRRREGIEALRFLLHRVSERQPVIVWIDDAQWDDRDSGTAMRMLLAGEPFRLALVLSCHSADASESALVRELRAGYQAAGANYQWHDIELSPLEFDERCELARANLSPDAALADEPLRQVMGRWSGIPFLVREFADHVNRRVAAGAVTSLDTLEVTDVFRERIDALPPAARELLEVLAVAGGPMSHGAIMEITAAPVDHETIDLLHDYRLVRRRERKSDALLELDMYHNRIGSAVIDTLNADVKQAYHRCYAEAFEAGSNSEQISEAVRHWQDAGDPTRAARLAIRAARLVEDQLAFGQAVALYTLALQAPPQGEAMWSLQERLAAALANDGQGYEAAKAYEEAARLRAHATQRPRDHEALRLRRRAAECYLRNGHIEEGLAVLRGVLRDLNIDYPMSRAELLAGIILERLRIRLAYRNPGRRAVTDLARERVDACWTGTMGFVWADNLRSIYFQAKHIRLSLELGEPERVVRALAIDSAYLAVQPGASARRRSARNAQRALTLVERMDDLGLKASVLRGSGAAHFLQGHWADAVRDCSRSLELLRCEDRVATWENMMCQLFRQWSWFFLGSIQRMADALPGAIEDARANANQLGVMYLQLGLCSVVWLAKDRPDTARQIADEVFEPWPKVAYSPVSFSYLISRVQADLYTGDGRSAARAVTGDEPQLTRSFLLKNPVIRGLYRYLRASAALAAARGDHALIRSAAADARRLSRERAPWCRALGYGLGAAVLAARGDRDGATSALIRAEQAFRDSGMALFADVARHHRAHLSGRSPRFYEEDRLGSPIIRDPDRFAYCLLPVDRLR